MNKLRILLTGGGSGGHIFPLAAVAEEFEPEKVELSYLGPASPLAKALAVRGVKTDFILSSKLRRYFSFENVSDIFRFGISFLQSLWKIYWLMPDIVFSKGGPGALAVVLTARFYFIPVIIHDSDAVPGLTNKLCAGFAKRIGISFKKAFLYFPQEKTALVGNPIRPELQEDVLDQESAKKFLGFDPAKPLVFAVGGSLGSERINDLIAGSAKELLTSAQILHQTGTENYNAVLEQIKAVFGSSVPSSYKPVSFLEKDMKDALSAADLVISRAGASSIYEIAFFGKPSILVPLEESAGNHQKENAYEYAETGAAVVIEESNFTPNILLTQIRKILEDAELRKTMSEAARKFFKPEAARQIAEEIVRLGTKEMNKI